MILVHNALSCKFPHSIMCSRGIKYDRRCWTCCRTDRPSIQKATFYIVSSKAEIKILYRVWYDIKSIALNATTNAAPSSVWGWLGASGLKPLDIAFNMGRSPGLAIVEDVLPPFGSYVRHKDSSEPVKLPVDAHSSRIIDIASLIKRHPAKLSSFLSSILKLHSATPFKISLVMSDLLVVSC